MNRKKTQHIQGSVLTMVSCVHWGSWNACPSVKGGLLAREVSKIPINMVPGKLTLMLAILKFLLVPE